MNGMRAGWLASAVMVLAGVLTVTSLAWANPEDTFPELDVGYAPTPEAAIAHMFEMADVGAGDVLVDLGSADGRIPIAAVRDRDVRKAIGIELDPWWQAVARERARAAGVDDRVEFVEGDLFEYDFYQASVVTMYLLPELNLRLRPLLLERLAPGSRVLSHTFDMGDWVPDEYARIQRRDLYMWTIPAQVAGRWQLDLAADESFSLELTQQFQHFEGAATTLEGLAHRVAGRLEGRSLQFYLDGRALSGALNESGEIHAAGGEWVARRLPD